MFKCILSAPRALVLFLTCECYRLDFKLHLYTAQKSSKCNLEDRLLFGKVLFAMDCGNPNMMDVESEFLN